MLKLFAVLGFFLLSCGMVKLATKVPYTAFPGAQDVKYVEKDGTVTVEFRVEAHCRSEDVFEHFRELLSKHGFEVAEDTSWVTSGKRNVLTDKRTVVYKNDKGQRVSVEVECSWVKVRGNANAYISTENQMVRVRYLGFSLDKSGLTGSICNQDEERRM